MFKVDCLGDFCPIPLLKAQEASGSLGLGECFMLVTDHSCTEEALRELFENSPFHVESDEVINGVWEITITRFR